MEFTLLYLDPGSGSYILQAIIAGVLGFGFYFRNALVKVKTFFVKKDRGEENEKLGEDKSQAN